MKIYKQITNAIVTVADCLCILAVVGLVGMIVAELFNRNILNSSFRASIEICGILFLWMAFMGIIPLYRNNGLMRLDFLVGRCTGTAAQLMYLVNKLFSLMLGCTMVIAFWAQYPYVNTRDYATLPSIPYTVQYVPMAIAGAYIAIKTVEQLIEWGIELAHGTKPAA